MLATFLLSPTACQPPAELEEAAPRERQANPWGVLGEEPALSFAEHDREVRVPGLGGTSLWVGAYEVTQAVYQASTGQNPSADPTCERRGQQWIRPDYPVICVSWNDAVSFANQLSLRDGLEPAYTIDRDTVTRAPRAAGYRLPSAEEWEWLARAGNDAPSDPWCYLGNAPEPGPDSYVPTSPPPLWGCSGPGFIRRIGAHAPNGWGLYHMTGNVGELVGEPGAVEVRGLNIGSGRGSEYDARYPTSATRETTVTGFRLVRPALGAIVEP